MELRPSAVFLFLLEVTENLRLDLHSKNLGREERFRTVISGMEPRRIAVVMLLPRMFLKVPNQGIA
jgi:hypothetical protein